MPNAKQITQILLAVLLVSFPLASQAGWSNEAVRFANENFGEFPGPRSIPREIQGDMATVFGGALREIRFTEDLREDELNIKIPELFKKDMKVFLRKQDHKAPLLVFIPGVFSNADDGIARGTVKWFSDMGYHVLTMPNCWSPDFAKARPIYKEEYPGGEASAVTAITEKIISENIGAKNITSVQLMGESLGALTAAVVYARDSHSKHPLFTAGATMTWPPIALHDAIGKLDAMIIDTDAIYKLTCHGSIKRLKTKWRVLRGKYLLEPTQEEIKCAPAIVAQYAFRKELVKLAKTINKSEKLGRTVPDNLTFATFIKQFAPRYAAALSNSDQYGHIEYWLHETDAQAAKKIRILSSEDDFLNEQMSWDIPGFFAPAENQLIVAHWGGHIGLTNIPAYKDFIKTQFALH